MSTPRQPARPTVALKWVRLRLGVVAVVFAIGFLGLTARAWQLQISEGEALEKLAQGQYLREIEITPARGVIYDRGLSELAVDVEVESIYANPRKVTQPELAARKLARSLGLGRKKLERRLSSKRHFVWIKRRVTGDEAQRVRDLGLAGVAFTKEARRSYPHGRLASHVIGFAGIDQTGLEGLEHRLEKSLRGRSFVREGFRDGLGRVILAGGLMPPSKVRGDDVVLTIDRAIQFMAERELRTAVEEHGAKAGQIIVMEPRSGHVLALAGYPDFDPNSAGKFAMAKRRNRVVADSYEPGSTLKAMVMAAALEKKVIKANQTLFCENGKMRFGGHTIHDHLPHADTTLTEIIKYSSNICAAKLGKRLGRQGLYDALRAFGFGTRPRSGMSGESRGIVRKPQTWSEVGLATISFGQGISVTTMQLAAAFSALANGGELMRPRIVQEIRSPEGEPREVFRSEVVRRVVSEDVAKRVTRMMVEVVHGKGGTGGQALVPGYKVAGKTATAQKVDFVTGQYSKDKRIGSFAGYLPAHDPRVVIVVMIDEPEGKPYGGIVAAPAFSRLGASIMRHMVVPATEPIEKTPAEIAAAAAAGEGNAIDEEEAPEPFAEAEVVASPEQGLRMPQLTGRSMRAVLEALAEQRLGVELEGSGRAISQEPAAGTMVKPGTVVRVRFSTERGVKG